MATGGIDCGTGIGPMMEAARMIALSGAKPKRTILFVAFAGKNLDYWVQSICQDSCKRIGKDCQSVQPGRRADSTGEVSVPQAMYDDFVEVYEACERDPCGLSVW